MDWINRPRTDNVFTDQSSTPHSGSYENDSDMGAIMMDIDLSTFLPNPVHGDANESSRHQLNPSSVETPTNTSSHSPLTAQGDTNRSACHKLNPTSNVDTVTTNTARGSHSTAHGDPSSSS